MKQARGLTSGLVKLAAILGMLGWLAACTTGPFSISSIDPSDAPITTPAATSDQPESLDTLAQVARLPSRLKSTPVRSALLAGEVARVFEQGHASWYGSNFHGRLTANGERYNMHAFTAAHRTLPFGTMVRVHSLVNGRDVDVRITDRGPFSHNRIIDVSRATAQELGMLGLGFKEVVLLVPESALPVSEAPPTATRKPRQKAKRRPGPKAR